MNKFNPVKPKGTCEDSRLNSSLHVVVRRNFHFD
jgi:hypothetical protein